MYLTFRQIEDLSRVIAGSEFSVRQLSIERVCGWAIHQERSGINCSAGSTKGHVELTGPVSDQNILIGVASSAGRPARHFGKSSTSDSLLVYPSGEDQNSYYGGGVDYAGISLPAEKLLEVAHREKIDIPAKTLASPISQSATATVKTSAGNFIQALKLAEVVSSDEHLEDAIDRLICEIVHAISNKQGYASSTNQYDLLVRRALELIDDGPNTEINVSYLCNQLSCSRRRFERAFRNELDVSPAQFLQSKRLMKTRRDIQIRVRNGQATIAETALANGFYELGKFAAYYKRMFGELPSDTART
ncbi:MAG: helix-turn-helix domain-containing protein [Hyphomicrobiaceae bacterium]